MISKRTIVILNVAILVLFVLAFLSRYILGFSFVSSCHTGIKYPEILTYCIGNFPIEFAILVVQAISKLLLLVVLFLDIFWLIRRFVKKQ